MTWSAPSDRTKSTFSVRQTPVTSAPIHFAIWTANGPMLPDAPPIRTFAPGCTVRPFRSRRPCNARIAECGSVEAVSKLMPSGIGRKAFSGADTDSANEPCPAEKRSAKTRSPTRNRVTFTPTASMVPATSEPSLVFRGRRTPRNRRRNDGRGWIWSRSARLTDAAWTRTTISPSPGTGVSISATRTTSERPYRSRTAAFIATNDSRVEKKWWRWGRVELPVQDPSPETTTSVSDGLSSTARTGIGTLPDGPVTCP